MKVRFSFLYFNNLVRLDPATATQFGMNMESNGPSTTYVGILSFNRSTPYNNMLSGTGLMVIYRCSSFGFNDLPCHANTAPLAEKNGITMRGSDSGYFSNFVLSMWSCTNFL